MTRNPPTPRICNEERAPTRLYETFPLLLLLILLLFVAAQLQCTHTL